MTAPAVIGPEAARTALLAEGERDAKETAARLAPLEAAAQARGRAAAALAAQVDTTALEARTAVDALRREQAAFERRQLAREWELRQQAPPTLFAFADALSAHADGLLMDRLDASPSSSRGEAAHRCRQLARELREEVAILPGAEVTAALARIREEVALMLSGVPQWQARFLLPFLTESTEDAP